MSDPSEIDGRAAELTAMVDAIRDRVRARYPGSPAAGLALPDLTPVLHARDAAEGKVAAIGTVNPRPPGLLNNTLQAMKRFVSRALDWHVREQVEYNRAVVIALDSILEAFNDSNRALVSLSGSLATLSNSLASGLEQSAADRERADASLAAELASLRESGRAQSAEFQDLRTHWAEWRPGFERKLDAAENHLLRSIAELQIAYQQRANLIESGMRDQLSRGMSEVQKAMWVDLARMRSEIEQIIHMELRLIRQRAALAIGESAPVPGAPAPAPLAAGFDSASFAERFRGSEEYVRNGQRFYVPHFSGCRQVLDIGCGRGEFLELMRDAGIPARGIDLSRESVALCRAKELEAEVADLFEYLAALPDGALDGIFSAQVVEHIPPDRLPEMIRLAASKLAPGGTMAIETPNPECLAIFATHFYLDPTHQRPVPPQLLGYYLEEAGMGGLQMHRLSGASETMPSLKSLPADFRDAFFGALDYSIIARKL